MKNIIIFIIRMYQKYISPLQGPRCRFYPTCSEYAIQAILRYGVCKGSIKAIIRILKCHPFHSGGYDPVK